MAGANTHDPSLDLSSTDDGRQARRLYAQGDASSGRYRILFLVVFAAGALVMVGMAITSVYTIAAAIFAADGERVLVGVAICFWPAVFGVVVGRSMRSKARVKRPMAQVAQRLSAKLLEGSTGFREELAWLDARDWPLTDHVTAVRDVPPFGYRLVTTGEVNGCAVLVALSHRSHSRYLPGCARVDVYVAATAAAGRLNEPAFKAIGDGHGFVVELEAAGVHFRCHHDRPEAVAAVVPMIEAATGAPVA